MADQVPNKTDEPRIKVIGLIRVSTPGQAEDDHAGIARQRTAIARAAERHNLEVVQTIELIISGTKTRSHPQFKWMRQMLESRQVAGIATSELGRILRPKSFGDYELLDSFVNVGAKIYTDTGVHDCADEGQQLNVLLQFHFSGWERRLLLKRVNDARLELQKKGAHVWGAHQLPLGISYHRKSMVYSLNPEIAKVQEAFRLVDEEGLNNVEKVAERVGIATRTLHRILRNPLYAGYKVVEFARDKETTTSKNGKAYHAKVPLPENQKIKVKVMDEPAIPVARWERVQRILEQKGKVWKAQHKVGPKGNMLRGLTFCGECGSKLYLQPDSRRPTIMGYFKCSKGHYANRGRYRGCGAKNQRQSTLQEVTTQFLTEYLNQPKIVKAILQHAADTKLATLEEPMPDASSAGNAGSVDWEERGRRLDKLFEMGRIDAAELAVRIAQVEKEKATFEDRQKAKETAQRVVHQEKLIDTTAARIIRGARAFRRITNPDWKYKALKSLFKEIHYSNGQITAFMPREDIFPESKLGDVCENRLQSATGSWPRRA
jgi:DNA invertase Pin-like site-specific DNA recombinase